MVIWFIGLSGSGKTTISTRLYSRLKSDLPNLVRLDGDVLRDVFGNDVDHTIEGRRRNAERISMLSRLLADQNIHVIAAVLSIFPDWQAWNREHIRDYAEVYLKASKETLLKRDIKDLYEKAYRGERNNVVGVDIPFPEPASPELIINNDEDLNEFDDIEDRVMNLEVIQNTLKSL